MEDVVRQIRNKVERTMDLPLYRGDLSTPLDLRTSFQLDVDLHFQNPLRYYRLLI